MTMPREYKHCIKENGDMLFDNLVVDDRFLGKFLSDDVITDEQYEDIMHQTTSLKQISAFLRLIQKRGERAWGVMMEALKSTGQGHIATTLEGSLPPEPYHYRRPGRREGEFEDSGSGSTSTRQSTASASSVDEVDSPPRSTLATPRPAATVRDVSPVIIRRTEKTYTVDVVTGDVPGAGTDANVFLTIYGEHGDSSERKLQKSETNKWDKFERGQLDRFKLKCPNLGRLTKVKIRHDNSNFNPAWFLDRVEVADPREGALYTFHCERWLGKKKEDGKIERVLFVKGHEEKQGPPPESNPGVMYEIKVKTGEKRIMGTQKEVWIKIFNRANEHTGTLSLETKNGFTPGSVRKCRIEAPDVGDVNKIELGLYDCNVSWFVEEVEIDLSAKGKRYIFTCQKLLGRETQRCSFSVERGATSVLDYKPKVPFEVTVVTEDRSWAGTDAQIFIKAFGSGCSSSDIPLEKLSDRFERGQKDVIKVEMEDVDPIKKLRIGHNGQGQRPHWYVKKVTLRNMKTKQTYVFRTDCVLSRSKGDRKIVKDFVAFINDEPQLNEIQYKISVKTGNVRGAGTDANVYVILFGEYGDSGELSLDRSETFRDPFEKDRLDVFTIPPIWSLGQLYKVRVWHDNRGLGAAWHLAHIQVEDCHTKQKYTFPCNRWLARGEDDGQVCRELTCASVPPVNSKNKINYEIKVTTLDKRDAGTDHNVWMVLEGDQQSSKEFVIENEANNFFKRGQTETFTFSSRNLGSIERCVLGAVRRGGQPFDEDEKWQCSQVVVTDTHIGDRYIFIPKKSIPVERDIDTEYARILKLKRFERGRQPQYLAQVRYEVSVVTGTKSHAGTDANVFITIYGKNGDSGRRALKKRFRDLFEKGRTDKFEIEAVDLGELSKIRIEHDNSGFGAGWLLDHVRIRSLTNLEEWKFPCGQWLDRDKGDGQICRELLARR